MTDTYDANESGGPREEGQGPGEEGQGEGEGSRGQGKGPEVFGEQIKHRQLSARVPDHVGRGVFSTGAIVLTGGTEFVLDFLVRMARPYQVAARVVMPHAALVQFIKALRDNIGKYENRFGEIEAMPQGDPSAKRPSIQEVYDDLKLPDDQLSGDYANACIIGHSPAEFVFDFVTNFFPRSAVASSVYLSARQVPQLLKGVEHAVQQLEQRRRAAQDQNQQQATDFTPPITEDNPPPPGPPPPPDEDEEKPEGEADLMY